MCGTRNPTKEATLDILDSYELKARVFPALLLAISVAAGFLGYLDGLQHSWVQVLTGGGVWVVAAYPLSFVARYLGRRIEPGLWETWGGPPSTRLARWSDDTLGEDLKTQLHAAAKALCEVQLLGRQEEAADPNRADWQIGSAFQVARGVLRRRDPAGLWYTHNAEYGFSRNLLGSRSLWLALSVVGCLAAATPMWYGQSLTALDRLGFGIAALSLLLALGIGWLVLARHTSQCAERYAESAWTALIALYLQESAGAQEDA